MKKYKLNVNDSNDNFLQKQKELKDLISKKLLWEISDEELEKIKFLNKEIFDIINFTKQSIATILNNPLWEKINAWQDNLVFDYRKNWVVKILHDKRYNDSLLEYYQLKYKLLKKYVWDFIPDTYFFDGEIVNLEPFNYKNLGKYKIVYDTIYSIQRKVNGYTLKDLPLDIKKSEDLYIKLKMLHEKYMKLELVFHFFEYKISGKISRSSFKMDLWKLSNIFKFDKQFVFSLKTPNVMWDINKNKLFLVDFDTGKLDWNLRKVFEKVLSLTNDEFNKISDTLRYFLKKHKYKKLNKEVLYRMFNKVEKYKKINL